MAKRNQEFFPAATSCEAVRLILLRARETGTDVALIIDHSWGHVRRAHHIRPHDMMCYINMSFWVYNI